MSSDLRVEGDFTIVAASTQREQWLGWLTETAGADFAEWPQVRLDLSSVEAFDSAAVQLLLALQRSLRQRAQALVLVAPTGPVTEALHCFGLQDQWPLAAGAEA